MEFSGKTAFVTGAANGIGLGICRALARAGVNLVLADIERTALEKAREELATFNVRTRAIEVDVSDARIGTATPPQAAPSPPAQGRDPPRRSSVLSCCS